MMDFLTRFRTDHRGAITVDYIVLTAAVILLAGVTANAVSQGAFDGIADISEHLTPNGCAVTNGGTTDLSACN